MKSSKRSLKNGPQLNNNNNSQPLLNVAPCITLGDSWVLETVLREEGLEDNSPHPGKETKAQEGLVTGRRPQDGHMG